MTSETILNLLIIAFLILVNAFFVAAEYALVRMRRTRVEELSKQGLASAKAVKEALERINLFISTAQVGITAASLSLGWIAQPFLAHALDRFFGLFTGTPASEGGASTVAHVFAAVSLAVALVVITFVHVVVGEQMPKLLALQFSEKLALFLIHPMRFFMALFRPLVWVLNEATSRLLGAFGLKPAPPPAVAPSEEELLLLVSESKKAGVVTEDEQRMLQRVFKFHSKTVREIMVPPPDIVSLELRASLEQIQAAFRQGYSRLPVHDGNLNNIKGIVYVKDLMYTLADPRLIKVVDLLRETIFVPESKAVSELLRELQKNRLHMAIVVDEFGDTAGLVTLEDIIEEIVGDIQDEYDVEPAQVERAPDGSVVFDGKTPLDRFQEIYPDFPLPEGTYETVAGLVFQIAGRVPKEADVLRQGGLVFRVVKREGRRLRRISIRREAPGGASITQVLGPVPAGAKTEPAAVETSSSGRLPKQAEGA
jgi:CBS domain containing-hemolysin-like protein